MPLFEVAVLEHPTKEAAEKGEQEKLVFGPKTVVAKDPQTAALAAIAGEASNLNLSRAQVLVRPFA